MCSDPHTARLNNKLITIRYHGQKPWSWQPYAWLLIVICNMNRKRLLTGNDGQVRREKQEKHKNETDLDIEMILHEKKKKAIHPTFPFPILWFIGPQKPQRCNLQKCVCWKSVHPPRFVSPVCFPLSFMIEFLWFTHLFLILSFFPAPLFYNQCPFLLHLPWFLLV